MNSPKFRLLLLGALGLVAAVTLLAALYVTGSTTRASAVHRESALASPAAFADHAELGSDASSSGARTQAPPSRVASSAPFVNADAVPPG